MDNDDNSELILHQTANLNRRTLRLEDTQRQLAVQESSLALKTSELEDSQAQLTKDKMALIVANQSNAMAEQQLNDALVDFQKERLTARLQIQEAENKLISEEQSAEQKHSLAVMKFRSEEKLAMQSFRGDENLAFDKFRKEESSASNLLRETKRKLDLEQQMTLDVQSSLELRNTRLSELQDDIGVRELTQRAVDLQLREEQSLVQRQEGRIVTAMAELERVNND